MTLSTHHTSAPMQVLLEPRQRRHDAYSDFQRTPPLNALTVVKFAMVAWLLLSGRAADAAVPRQSGEIRPALGTGQLGLYESSGFRLGSAKELGAEPKAAFWFFGDDIVATPTRSSTAIVTDDAASVEHDIRHWVAAARTARTPDPFLVWIGSPAIIEGATLRPDGNALQLADTTTLAFAVVPKIPSNRSYLDASSVAYLAGRSLRIRGSDGTRIGVPFTGRSIWPEDWRLGAEPSRPLVGSESLATLIESDGGGALSPFTTRVLWERSPGSAKSGAHRAVLGFILNGAQGDDDEAHAGHFAVVTGWTGPEGRMADWMVNNFYNLGSVSEKGIIAAMLPMDSYMTDLNSGQAWYRPSYMLVAVLDDVTPAQQFQAAIVRVFERFYRQHVEYDHARANCAGISIDTLSGLGWQFPRLGPTSYPKAVAGYFYSSATDMSFASGRRTFDYLTEDRVRLYPRAAFETLGKDLLALASWTRGPRTAYETSLSDHVQAIVFVRIPQIPSSRAMGTHPVDSFDAFMARVPADRQDWKVVPVDARVFPEALRDRPRPAPALSDAAVGLLSVGALTLTAAAPVTIWRRRRKRQFIKPH